MATSLKNLSSYNEKDIPSCDEMYIGIVVAEWNSEITHALYEGCYSTLVKHGVKEENIETAQVPGSFELTSGARILAQSKSLDAIICLGCVIRGETSHNEYINMAVAQGLTNMSIASGKPFIFGLLTPGNIEQAKERAGGRHGNKGVEAAVTALRMAELKKSYSGGKSKIGF